VRDQPAAGSAPPIDHRSIDWGRVSRAGYALEQRFTYEYPGPITDLHQQLVVVPRAAYGDQVRRHYRVDVSTKAAHRSEKTDGFGNHVVTLHLPRVEHRVEFSVTLELERSAGAVPPLERSSEAAQYLLPTRLTEPDGALAEAAVMLARQWHASVAEHALAITRWVHETMRYQSGVTTVHTTAGEAFALRAGVCQDYAHVMLAICRLNGIPARYVSGHLLGEGGTHAWVEVLAPAGPELLAAHPFDPTHGTAAGLGYLTIGAGRDYQDVAPAAGWFVAPYTGVLTTRKQAVVTSVEYRGPRGAGPAELGAA
jgi:transglutaminase-like putative cysteine protease